MRTLSALTALLLFATSCHKTDTEDTNRNTLPPGLRLVKIICIDTAVAAPLDTVRTTFFQYDGNGRVTLISEATNPHGPATGPKRPGFQTISFSYAGTDTKPNKSIGKIWGGNTPLNWEGRDTCWYSYNGAGKKTTDSTVSWSYSGGVVSGSYGNTSVHKQAYYTDSIVQVTITGSTDNYTVVPAIYSYKAELNASGQVMKTTYYPKEYNYTVNDYVANRQYGHTTIINPVSLLNIFHTLAAIPLSRGYGHYFGDFHFLSQENVINRMITNYETKPPVTETMVVTTNSYNLPVSFTSSNPQFFKVVFEYNQ